MHKPILFALLSAVVVILLVVLNRSDFRTWELSRAGTSANAAKVVDGWAKSGALDRKRTGVFMEFGMLACYGPAAVWGAAWAGRVFARGGSVPGARASLFVVGVALSAVAIDVAENVALLRMMGGATGEPWPRLAHVMSGWKGTVASVPVVYAAAGLARWWRGEDGPRMLGA